MRYILHRFSISGPDLRINARISSFTPSFVHRFVISGPNLRIDVSFSPLTPSFVHRFLISRPNLRIDAAQSSWRWRMARLQRLLRRRSSASDSILRCLERKWPACSRGSNMEPYPTGNSDRKVGRKSLLLSKSILSIRLGSLPKQVAGVKNGRNECSRATFQDMTNTTLLKQEVVTLFFRPTLFRLYT